MHMIADADIAAVRPPDPRIETTRPFTWVGLPRNYRTWDLGALTGFVLAEQAVDLRYAQTFGAVFGQPLEPACRPQALTLGLQCLEV